MEQVLKNTITEIWRANLNDPHDPDNAYAPSIYITTDGKIGINACGQVAEGTPDEWVELAYRRGYPYLPAFGGKELDITIDYSKQIDTEELAKIIRGQED